MDVRRDFDKLSRAAPDATIPLAELACEYLVSLQRDFRDFEAGLEVAENIVKYPHYPPWVDAVVALANYRTKRYEGALSRTSKIESQDNAGKWARLIEAAVYGALQQADEALSSLRRAEKLLSRAPVDDARLIAFYHEVAGQLGLEPLHLESKRPSL